MKASKRMQVNGKIENYSGSIILSIRSEGDSPTPVGFMTSLFMVDPLWVFFTLLPPTQILFPSGSLKIKSTGSS